MAQARVDKDTPSFVAMADVAPGVRLSAFAIFLTPALAFAIVFICRTSSLVHSRRTIFLALAIFAPFFVERPFITKEDNRNDNLPQARHPDPFQKGCFSGRKVFRAAQQRVRRILRRLRSSPGRKFFRELIFSLMARKVPSNHSGQETTSALQRTAAGT